MTRLAPARRTNGSRTRWHEVIAEVFREENGTWTVLDSVRAEVVKSGERSWSQAYGIARVVVLHYRLGAAVRL